ncbi:MAG: hypothetical protein ABF443_11840 [Acetobacter malorum]|uniref:hypothetical protein n=1 Tax=Acetobacter malorum TaxID=178901 RepID=UPI0039ED84A9
MTKYQKLKEAVISKKSVRFHYRDYVRVCSPHTIGHTDGKERILAYQYGGQSSRGLPPKGEWRCFDVEGISGLEFTGDDEWRTGERHTRPQTCVKNVEAEAPHS